MEEAMIQMMTSDNIKLRDGALATFVRHPDPAFVRCIIHELLVKQRLLSEFPVYSKWRAILGALEELPEHREIILPALSNLAPKLRDDPDNLLYEVTWTLQHWLKVDGDDLFRLGILDNLLKAVVECDGHKGWTPIEWIIDVMICAKDTSFWFTNYGGCGPRGLFNVAKKMWTDL
jgi:hypothetical protein